MGKQNASRQKKRPGKKAVKQLEPFSQVSSDSARVADWFRRFDGLPLKEKNRAIRENAEVLTELFGGRVRNGGSLLGPLAAENQGDRDEGEFTFLVSLKPLRERLIAEYDIKTAAEFMLLDVVVLSYYQYIRAASNLHGYTAYGKSYSYETLVRYAQTYMVRANEMFLRNLDALRQIKAAPFIIKIEQVGQVNVGEKQVNLAADGLDRASWVTERAQPASESDGRQAPTAPDEHAQPKERLGPPATVSDHG